MWVSLIKYNTNQIVYSFIVYLIVYSFIVYLIVYTFIVSCILYSFIVYLVMYRFTVYTFIVYLKSWMIWIVNLQLLHFKSSPSSPGECNQLYHFLLINLLVYSTYTENLVCVILVIFFFRIVYTGFHLDLIQLTSH